MIDIILIMLIVILLIDIIFQFQRNKRNVETKTD